MGSNRSRPGTLDIHEGHAEDDINYVYKNPNHHELGNQDIQQHHETYLSQWPPAPSGTTSDPLLYPDPSEASERSSSLLTSLSSLPKKDDIEPITLLMYTERAADLWTLYLAPAKKNGEVKLAEESEMREEMGLMRGVESP